MWIYQIIIMQGILNILNPRKSLLQIIESQKNLMIMRNLFYKKYRLFVIKFIKRNKRVTAYCLN